MKVDEELARKLQAQFNAEAEIEALKKESITLSDEEYAQRLQVRFIGRLLLGGASFDLSDLTSSLFLHSQGSLSEARCRCWAGQ
jgi:hypothetical protein